MYQDADGKYICDSCERTFDTIIGLSSHRRGCTGRGLGEAKKEKPKKEMPDDMDVLALLIAKPLSAHLSLSKPGGAPPLAVLAGATGAKSKSRSKAAKKALSAEAPAPATDPHLWLAPAAVSPVQVGLPPEALPDLLCLAEFFAAFHEQLSVPKLTVQQLSDIVSSPARLDLAESVCCTMTKHIVQLSQSAPMPCGPTYFKYERDNFFGIRVSIKNDEFWI